ncbi:hypothetical protein HY798_04790 [Candidatus Falkowbacteria bacterium]|nr:hypothetical protein [Candidatus Falkowbacteria bacterium]
MEKLRKILAISTIFVTVLSMSVVVAPSAGATASAGSLIKMSGLSSVYYLAADGKRYVFPNETTYFSWYSDFSSVVTIPQSELESYPLGKNVTMRSGVKLVKITTDPKVYAVEPNGSLKWVSSETTASTLYGSNWAKRVVDVPDAFFTNYTIASGEVSATAYPTGSLVKWSDSADVYYVNSDGTASKIASEAAFTANRFNWNDVISATIAKPTVGSDITGAVATLTDTSAGAGGSAGAGTGLTVALASDTPASASIIADSTGNEYPQALIPFTKVNFTASADGDVKVTTVKFNRVGIAADSDLGNLYLYDGNTKLTEYTSFSSKVVTFSATSGLFTVSKGTTKAITLKGDLARGSTSVSSGKTIGFEVVAASSVVTDGASVSGSFPMTGNSMSTAAVTDLGHLYLSSYANTHPSTVKADEANKTLWTLNATADSQNMQISYLKFTMVGTIATTDIKNIKLELAGVQIATGVLAADNTLTFDLSASPIVINSGVTKQLALRGDMAGGSGRVFKFTIQRSADVVLYDTSYGVYVTPNITNTTTAFGVIEPTTGNGTSVSAGTLTLGVATDSPTGNIADGGTGLTLSKFSFYAAGEAVKVDNLTVKCATTTGSTFVLKNVKLLLDGSQVGTTDTSLTCDNGTDSTNYTFGNTFVIPAASTRYLTIVADTTDSTVDAGDTVHADLVTPGAANATGQTTLTSITSTAQTGRTLTVAAGTASAVKNTAFANRSSASPSGTVSATNVQIASFIITAGAGEAIDVTQIVLADDSTTEMGDNFQNLKIMNGTTQIGSTVSSLNTTAGNYTFTPSSAIRISAGQQYIVDVYADIKSSVADSATALAPVIKFGSLTATGVNTGTSASYDPTDIALQTAYISAQGNLTITLDTDSPLAQQLVMGATDQTLAKFKLAADAAEDINITKLVLNNLMTTAGTGTIKNIKLYDGTTQVGQAVTPTTDYATTTYGAFSGISLTITRNSNKIITVKGDVTSSDAGGTSGSTHELSVYPTYDGTNEPVTATGASSGQSITSGYLDIGGTTDVQVRGNQMTVYKTKVTVAFAADTPSGASVGGDDMTVAKINITNSANTGNYSANIAALNFAISQTDISNTADRELKIYKDSISSGNLLVTTNWVAAGNQNFGDTAITDAGMTDVEISAGATKLFIITMDTQNAGTNDKLSVNMAAGDIIWDDNTDTTGTDDIATVDSLPLTPKTLTY